ncbi:MAG TPA: hypothetical protein VH853_16580 [Polyangia bacterium]|jgi:hypothetical protein|nr:hypothetical protein [Polyangia bacterium]
MAAVTAGMSIFGWAAEHLSNNFTMVGIGSILLISAAGVAMVRRAETTRRLVENLARQP